MSFDYGMRTNTKKAEYLDSISVSVEMSRFRILQKWLLHEELPGTVR